MLRKTKIVSKVLPVLEKEPSIIKPFLRWAGGKQNLIKNLLEHLPERKFNYYFEPFLGAGSMFFANNFNQAILSDINPHLINSFRMIKDSPEALSDLLEYHRKLVSQEYYYQIRNQFNAKKETFDLEQAANFIFLVHTSFNGIYRVNQKGMYNVPFGKVKPAIPGVEQLKMLSSKLKGVQLYNLMYEDIVHYIENKDFVYFDPPYPPLNSTSFFQHYSIDKFPFKAQQNLCEVANELSSKGAFVMMSNADTPDVRQLYSNWNLVQLETHRYVNCKSERSKIKELVIKNY